MDLLIDLTSDQEKEEEDGAARTSASARREDDGDVIVLSDDDNFERSPRRKIARGQPQCKGNVGTSTGTNKSKNPADGDKVMDVEVVLPTDLETTDRQHAHLFRVLSWNIDGLSTQSRHFRTPAVVTLIEK